MRKVSCDLADGGEYAESFGLSTLIGTICGNYLSNKIVSCHTLLGSAGASNTNECVASLLS
jgi:hypothetical protein